MKINAKIDYACCALLELSLRWPNKTPLQIGEIAQRQNIPIKFLVHILIRLKEIGLVESVRGKKGGYVLSRSPQEISIAHIVQHLESDGILGERKLKNKTVFPLIWQDLSKMIFEQMAQINFEYVCKKSRQMEKAINYEI